MNTHWTEEKVYDEQIAPLMMQIIAICKEHRIPLACTFQYGDLEDGGPAFCSTLLPNDRQCEAMFQLNCAHQRATRVRSLAIAETHETLPDGSKRITIRRVG